MIAWLKWEWQETYLSPQLNKRTVLTASNVEIRSPINSRSIGGWQNYKDILTPAIKILKKMRNTKIFYRSNNFLNSVYDFSKKTMTK